MLRISTILIALPAFIQAVELPDILAKLGRATIPDSVEYRVQTRIDVAGNLVTTSATIAQAGSERQRIETEFDGRSVRIVRNGMRQRIHDLESGYAQTIPVSSTQTDALRQMQQLSRESWSAPRSETADRWSIDQTSGFDSTTAGRTLVWSTSVEAPVSIVQWSPKGDTIRTFIEWTLLEQRRIPLSIRIESAAAGRTTTMDLSFSEWRFPRSFPTGFFAIP